MQVGVVKEWRKKRAAKKPAGKRFQGDFNDYFDIPKRKSRKMHFPRR